MNDKRRENHLPTTGILFKICSFHLIFISVKHQMTCCQSVLEPSLMDQALLPQCFLSQVKHDCVITAGAPSSDVLAKKPSCCIVWKLKTLNLILSTVTSDLEKLQKFEKSLEHLKTHLTDRIKVKTLRTFKVSFYNYFFSFFSLPGFLIVLEPIRSSLINMAVLHSNLNNLFHLLIYHILQVEPAEFESLMKEREITHHLPNRTPSYSPTELSPGTYHILHVRRALPNSDVRIFAKNSSLFLHQIWQKQLV